MDAKTVKIELQKLLKVVPLPFPALGWYFTNEIRDNAIFLKQKGTKGCLFTKLKRLFKGGSLYFSSENAGCYGASCYLGFRKPAENAGAFLSEVEGFKKNIPFAQAFYKAIQARSPEKRYLVISKVNEIDSSQLIKVVNLWAEPIHLSGLVTLANYDSRNNDNVIFPFASGCQSLWTIPYKEQLNSKSRAVTGCIDPAVRKYLPHNILSFSITAERFVEMTANISESFLGKSNWLNLTGKIKRKYGSDY